VVHPARREQTIELLARRLSGKVPRAFARQRAGGDVSAAFDKKIARYMRALDEGANPAVVAAWIAEAEQQRDQAPKSSPLDRRNPRSSSATDRSAILADSRYTAEFGL
jgi:hypothetical protein